MEERSRRIVATAIDLAEKGGFEAVRLRDVAADAEVALGTLYRRFRSKEDLLIAALELETEELERRGGQHPAYSGSRYPFQNRGKERGANRNHGGQQNEQ